MLIKDRPHVRKEKFYKNGVTACHFVTGENTAATEEVNPPLGVIINRQCRPDHTVLDDLLDALCSLLADSPRAASSPLKIAASDPAFATCVQTPPE